MDKIGLIIFIVFVIFVIIRYLIIPNVFLLYEIRCIDNNNINNNDVDDTEENEEDSYIKERNSLLDDCLPPYTPVTIINTSYIQLLKKDMSPTPDYYNLPPPPPITLTMESNENEAVMNINDLPPPPSYEICVNNDRDINITVESVSDNNETNNRI
ncbi:hypothetical protein LY90DRAFT_673009 [Neocallimastix californiae]|uniref:Uncharacterized protein n=1 Tax=Neocallimastix californiae TaxID=1754190 RepID=A0A1Y2BPB4_9FUNG|nr:hypothetical protein LY90DRAFT_673009 [Neocallimastix californiae]|eukprot:ORY36593.1 hypothetical protein LY90DRAFT_673009 [Neocallimastix californiae]